MPYRIWGASTETGLDWSGSASYYALLFASALLLGLVLVATREQLRALNHRSWLGVGILSVASFFLSQFLPISLPWSNAFWRTEAATATVTAFATLPYLLAGATLNLPAAILVGLCGGLGRALGQTHSLVDVTAVGLTAATAAAFMQQNYSGRLFGLMRKPPVAGALAQPVLALITGLQVLTLMSGRAGLMAALDLALVISVNALMPLLLEGVVGGLLVVAILWIAPQWRTTKGTVPSPFRRSLQGRMVGTFLSFALVVVLLSTLVVFALITRANARLAAEQMVTNADAAALRLATLQRDLAHDLERIAADDQTVAAEGEQRSGVIAQAMRSAPQFTRIKLLRPQGIVVGDETTAGELTGAERQVAEQVAAFGTPQFAAERADEGMILTIGVPAVIEDTEAGVMLAEVAPAVLDDVLRLLANAARHGNAFVVDQQSRIVLAGGNLTRDVMTWELPGRDSASNVSPISPRGRDMYETHDPETGARRLVYYAAVAGSGWRVAAVLPNAVILRQTLGVMGPLMLLLLVISALFFLNIALFGRDTARPLAEMSRASRAIAAGGGLERPIRSDREDEIGQLSLSFAQMQRALKQRLDELSLLLSVSNDVASTVDIAHGMSAVLQATLRATGATGVRAVVRNPNAMTPLIFVEGTGDESLAPFDRVIVNRLREGGDIALSSPREIEEDLGIAAGDLGALFALPLRTAGEFQGGMIVGYRQSHYFDSSERNLLRTLAGHASILVHNAHLFTAAEGGRRRLAAILASTSNAVVVTDQTDRVLLVNPAMERTFDISAADIVGRPVIEVLPDRALAGRLSMGLSAATGESEIVETKLDVISGERAFLASIATVQGSDGQALGRVAVLQDVSELKELDRLKSEFLAGISHDLLSPLTYMRNYASMLPVTDSPALEREYAARILAGIDRMTRLVNDLLDLARIEAAINLRFGPVALDALLSEVAQEYASFAHSQGVRLTVAAKDGMPAIVAERSLLLRAVTNLVTNAIKYAPNSGPIVLRAESRDGEAIISVTDRGPGISAVDRAHLFEKFYRGQSASNTARGSGLGLAIVSSIAEIHHGRVWCESVAGRGSTFFLAVPVERH